MSQVWPAGLPQAPGTWSEEDTPIIVRTEPDTGPAKTRKRFTKARSKAQMTFLLTIEQLAILRAFYYTDLQGGALPMLFTHPWTLTQKTMYVTKPPSYSSQDALAVQAAIEVEYF